MEQVRRMKGMRKMKDLNITEKMKMIKNMKNEEDEISEEKMGGRRVDGREMGEGSEAWCW